VTKIGSRSKYYQGSEYRIEDVGVDTPRERCCRKQWIMVLFRDERIISGCRNQRSDGRN